MIGLKVMLKCLLCLLICTVTLVGSGCRFPWTPQPVKSEPRPSPQLVKQYGQAVAAYQAEDYGTAAKSFQTIENQSVDRKLARRARFGLVCARLMEAKTPRQYHEAVALWDAWVEKSPSDFENENPVLMVPLIKEKMLFSNIPLTPDGRGDIEASPMVSQWLVINATKEIKRLKTELESDDQSSQKFKDRIASLEKEMAKLQKQIKALETIDQKIQKKKHAIPSTDSAAPR